MNKGQTAMEYLLVVSFAFMMLIPIILITVTQSVRFSTDVSSAQIQKVGSEIIDTVNSVYYAGPPTKRTVKLYFPKGIINISIQDQTIVFYMQGDRRNYEYAVFADSNMTGNLAIFSGPHIITIEAGDSDVNVTG